MRTHSDSLLTYARVAAGLSVAMQQRDRTRTAPPGKPRCDVQLFGADHTFAPVLVVRTGLWSMTSGPCHLFA